MVRFFIADVFDVIATIMLVLIFLGNFVLSLSFIWLRILPDEVYDAARPYLISFGLDHWRGWGLIIVMTLLNMASEKLRS